MTAAPISPPTYSSIRPGHLWLDTNGNRVHAHGSSIIEVDGFYPSSTPGKRDLHIALADRWTPDTSPEVCRAVHDDAARVFGGGGLPSPELEAAFARVDTSLADYVWLPIGCDGDVPTIDWNDEWRIEDVD